MKVKAKWAIKAGGEWHSAGEIFEVDSIAGLKGEVEIVGDEKPVQVKMEEVEPETAKPSGTVEAETEAKPRTATRTRKKTAEK